MAGNGCRYLRHRLQDAREARVKADGDARRNGPCGGDQERYVDAEDRRARAGEYGADIRSGQSSQRSQNTQNSVSRAGDRRQSQEHAHRL